MSPIHGINRRKFIAHTAWGTGFLGTGVAFQASAADSRSNPFAYDVGKYGQTDPKLLGYDEVGRFSALNPQPLRIAFGAEQRLYIAGRNGVTVLGKDGAKLGELPAPNARCVATAQDGTVFIGLRDHIEVFDPKGGRQGAWEAPGKKAWFTALAAGEKDLFAADSASRAILRYDRSGKLVGRIGEKNKERNIPGLIVPSPYLDVELAADGLLRVNNPGRHCVEAYTTDGDREASWGKPSAAVDGFCGCCNPIGIAMLPDGRCITCEKGLPRVKLYSAEGKFECVVAGPESFPQNAKTGSVRDPTDGTMGGLDAAVDPSGTIYILDLVVGDVRVMKRKPQV